MKKVVIAFALSSILFCVMSCKDQKYPGPLTPQEALESFQLREGFKIELFAAEPDVMDPIEMVFDEQGNAYVAEMPDYPYMPEHGEGAGRIRVLRDTDGDGVIDANIIFADSILEATSMLPWKGGLIVTAAPYIYYLKDTDGDMRADEKEILFSGFFENNSEAQITSLRYGVDNWIYAANNGQAGQVRFHRDPEAPALDMRGADFRFRLDRGAFELESGGAQFGQTMDDWGNRFITQNTLHIRQVVIPWRYLHRNPVTPPGSPLLNISDHDLEMFQLTPPPYWRAERTRRRQKQYEEQGLDRVEYAEDHFTGCSGGTIYDGDAFPAEYYGNVFTGEVAGNLVHRDVLVEAPDSPVLVARRAEGETEREFLASTDSWFRPTGFTVGPDGYLYVIDMYRQHIETPLSIPEDLKADMDFLYGSEHGRIYRIVPEGHQNTNPIPKLGEAKTAELVKYLTHANRWWRTQAQRLLLERQDKAAVTPAKEMFKNHEDARARLHAFYVLEGLDALTPDIVREAMKDLHPGVRKHGLIVAERYPELLNDILALTNDESLPVVLQAVLSAGGSDTKEVAGALANVVEKHGADPWFRTAVLSGKAASTPLLDALVQRKFFAGEEAWKTKFVEDFSYMLAAGGNAVELSKLISFLKQPAVSQQDAWQVAAAKGLVKGLARSEKASEDVKQWSKAVKVTNRTEAEAAIADVNKFLTVL